jgi:hypothetical protein
VDAALTKAEKGQDHADDDDQADDVNDGVHDFFPLWDGGRPDGSVF